MIHVSPTGHTSSSSSVGSSGWRTGCRRQGGPPGASPLPPHGGPGGTPRPAATGSPRTGPGPAGGGSASAAEACSWSHLREGETHTGLATGFDIGTTPVFRYIRESLQVLAALAPARRLDCGRRRVTGVRPAAGREAGSGEAVGEDKPLVVTEDLRRSWPGNPPGAACPRAQRAGAEQDASASSTARALAGAQRSAAPDGRAEPRGPRSGEVPVPHRAPAKRPRATDRAVRRAGAPAVLHTRMPPPRDAAGPRGAGRCSSPRSSGCIPFGRW